MIEGTRNWPLEHRNDNDCRQNSLMDAKVGGWNSGERMFPWHYSSPPPRFTSYCCGFTTKSQILWHPSFQEAEPNSSLPEWGLDLVIHFKWTGEKHSFKVHRPGRHHLTQGVKVNLANDKSDGPPVWCDKGPCHLQSVPSESQGSNENTSDKPRWSTAQHSLKECQGHKDKEKLKNA